jgi:hypothetical protein
MKVTIAYCQIKEYFIQKVNVIYTQVLRRGVAKVESEMNDSPEPLSYTGPKVNFLMQMSIIHKNP